MIPDGGLLGPIERTRRESRASHRLPMCWERIPDGGLPGGKGWDAPELASQVRPFLPLVDERGDGAADLLRGEEAVLVMLAPHAPRGALDSVLSAADRGARVYVLASPGFGEGKQDPGLQQRRDGRVLVRRLDGLPVSCVIAQRGARAGIWLGSAANVPPRWWMPLSVSQGEALFRIALHLFWHEAEEEAWTGSGPLRFQKVLERPFDIPLPRSGASVQSVGPGAHLKVSAGDVLYLPTAALPQSQQLRPDVLFRQAHAQAMEQLAALAQNGTRVVWEELGLPAFCVNTGDGQLVVESGPGGLRIQLEPAQASALHRLAMLAHDRATWRFRTGLALADLQGEIWLPGATALQRRRDEVELGAETVPSGTLRQMPDCAPQRWPDIPELALNVTYRWKVMPPRLPAGASEAPLVREWKKLDEEVAKRVQTLKSQLSDVDSHSSVLSKTFAALAGALLGFGRERKDVAREVESVASRIPSTLGCEEARALLERLSDLESRASKLKDNMAQAEHQAREDQEREEQQRAHELKRQEAERELAKAKEQLEALAPELANKEEEKQQAQQELEKSPQDKDLKARVNKLGGEFFQLEKQRKAADAALRKAEQVLKEPFEFRPSRAMLPARESQRPGHRFVPEPQARKMDNVPAEALPSTGNLFQHKTERFLVIARWEELSQGEAEALRLKARLVAPLEAR